MGYKIDFKALVASVSIEDVANLLGLKLVESGDELRCKCPHCDSEDDRGLSISPERQSFKCWIGEDGARGDAISLVKHIKRISTWQSAKFIQDNLSSGKTESSTEKTEPQKATDSKEETVEKVNNWQGLTHLKYENEKVQAVGLDPETAEALGIGWCNKGMMVSRIAVPVRLPDGSIAGYVGVKGEDIKLPKEWHL